VGVPDLSAPAHHHPEHVPSLLRREEVARPAHVGQDEPADLLLDALGAGLCLPNGFLVRAVGSHQVQETVAGDLQFVSSGLHFVTQPAPFLLQPTLLIGSKTQSGPGRSGGRSPGSWRLFGDGAVVNPDADEGDVEGQGEYQQQ
jgi:hypothetical protein